jgi:ubiquinone/menaquinone biosynthesis C-methylase UbiE
MTFMASYIEKTIAAYDRSPNKYFESTRDMTPPQELCRFTESVRSLGNRVLDAGCAFGRDSSVLDDAGFEVTGIDLSDGLLQKARELNPDLDFKKMDVRSLEFADGTFDGIWCHAVLLHLNDEDIVKALEEFHRVLKPDGTLFISFKKGEGTQEVLETFSSEAARFYNFKTVEPLTATLQEIGFTNVDAYYINEQELFGADKRDLDWIHCFSVKA